MLLNLTSATCVASGPTLNLSISSRVKLSTVFQFGTLLTLPESSRRNAKSIVVLQTEKIRSHPAKYHIQCNISHPAKYHIQCNISHPAKYHIQCNISHPAKYHIQCNISHPAKYNIQGNISHQRNITSSVIYRTQRNITSSVIYRTSEISHPV